MKAKSNLRKLFLNISIVVLLWAFGGCALTRNPVPIAQISQAKVVGMPNIRCWEFEYNPRLDQNAVSDSDCSFLALSGGGANGAFGAGFLCGWSAAGTRPNFRIVTGISTGSLIAPAVFAGAKYDETLKNFYTTVETKDVLDVKGLLALLRGESYAASKPLADMIAKAVDEEVLKRIAEEHTKGRRLYIGTTNLDAGRLMIWDMGAIASSGSPDALALFRKVMLASSSIPGALPPVFFNVEADGKVYDEMHVDGGVVTEVFGYGDIFENPAVSDKLISKTCHIYVIRNGKLAVEPKQIPRKSLKIIGRSIDTLMKAHSWADIFRLYFVAQRNKVDFNYVSIPDNYISSGKEMFDEKEMNQLFNLGFDMAKSGYKWNKVPVGCSADENEFIWTP